MYVKNQIFLTAQKIKYLSYSSKTGFCQSTFPLYVNFISIGYSTIVTENFYPSCHPSWQPWCYLLTLALFVTPSQLLNPSVFKRLSFLFTSIPAHSYQLWNIHLSPLWIPCLVLPVFILSYSVFFFSPFHKPELYSTFYNVFICFSSPKF